MSDRSFPLTVVTETNVRDLAQAIASAIHDHDDILEFVLVLDETVADYDFTVELRNRLTAAIKAEDEAADPPMPEPEVGEWVEAWDAREEVTVRGRLAFHLSDVASVLEQRVPGDSRVYQLDVVRSTLRKCVG